MQGYCYDGAKKNVRARLGRNGLSQMSLIEYLSGSLDVVKLMPGQMLGVAYQCPEVSQGGEAVTRADWIVKVSADSANPQSWKERLEVLSWVWVMCVT